MTKYAGLKIGTGENEAVLIDEFGDLTREGVLAGAIGVLSLFGALVITKNVLGFRISRKIKKGKKNLRRAKAAKVKAKNQNLKKEMKHSSAALKKQIRVNQTLEKEQEKLKKQLEQREADQPASAASAAGIWKVVRSFLF